MHGHVQWVRAVHNIIKLGDGRAECSYRGSYRGIGGDDAKLAEAQHGRASLWSLSRFGEHGGFPTREHLHARGGGVRRRRADASRHVSRPTPSMESVVTDATSDRVPRTPRAGQVESRHGQARSLEKEFNEANDKKLQLQRDAVSGHPSERKNSRRLGVSARGGPSPALPKLSYAKLVGDADFRSNHSLYRCLHADFRKKTDHWQTRARGVPCRAVCFRLAEC